MSDWVPGLDLATGTFTLPLWAVGVAAALFVALIVIAVIRAGLTEFGGLIFRVAVIVIAVVFGWTYINRASERDRADEPAGDGDLDPLARELAVEEPRALEAHEAVLQRVERLHRHRIEIIALLETLRPIG